MKTSELSEKFAVAGGNRSKYCVRIGMSITQCMLLKTCKECMEEQNATKRPENDPQTPEKNTNNEDNNDQNGLPKRQTSPRNRPKSTKRTLKKPTNTRKNSNNKGRK